MARRQPFAAFGAAAFDDQTAGLGAHPFAKAMRLGAAAIIRLKGTFHNLLSPEMGNYAKSGRLTTALTDCQG
jgi:hypothetical protein